MCQLSAALKSSAQPRVGCPSPESDAPVPNWMPQPLTQALMLRKAGDGRCKVGPEAVCTVASYAFVGLCS